MHYYAAIKQHYTQHNLNDSELKTEFYQQALTQTPLSPKIYASDIRERLGRQAMQPASWTSTKLAVRLRCTKLCMQAARQIKMSRCQQSRIIPAWRNRILTLYNLQFQIHTAKSNRSPSGYHLLLNPETPENYEMVIQHLNSATVKRRQNMHCCIW